MIYRTGSVLMNCIIPTCFAVFLLCNFSAYSQNSEPDSLKKEIEKFRATKKELGKMSVDDGDTTLVKLLNALGKKYSKQDPEEALRLADEAYSISKLLNYKLGIGESLHRKGYAQLAMGNHKSAILLFSEAIEVMRDLDSRKLAIILNDIGQAEFFLENYPAAIRHQYDALKFHEKTGDQEGLARTYLFLGNLYAQQSKFESSEQALLKSISIFKSLGYEKQAIVPMSSLSIVFEMQDKLNESLIYAQEALAFSIKSGMTHDQAVLLSTIANIQLKQNNPDLALRSLEEALILFKKINNVSATSRIMLRIGDIHIRKKDYKKAEQMIEPGLILARQSAEKGNLAYAYKIAYEFDSARSDYKAALTNFKLHILYRDSIYNHKNTEQISQIESQYEQEKIAEQEQIKREEAARIASIKAKSEKQIRMSLGAGLIIALGFTGFLIVQRRKIITEKIRSDVLLRNIFPAKVIGEINKAGSVSTRSYTMATVLFADFTDFTKVGEKISAELLVKELHECFSAFDTIVYENGVEKIKTIGDAYLCAGGIPEPNLTHASDIIKTAIEMRKYIQMRNEEKQKTGEPFFNIRIGIFTGPVVAGVVGLRKYAYDIWGDTVNTAARIEQLSKPGQISIGKSTYDLVKDIYPCKYEGKAEAKNKGPIDIYTVEL